MKAYLAGPMAGYPDHNWPLFKRVTTFLRSRKYTVFCATESGGNPALTYLESLKLSLIHMLQADTILLLPGWEKSRGATLELLLASALEYEIYRVRIENEDITIWGFHPSKWAVAKYFLLAHFPDRIKDETHLIPTNP